MKLIFTILFFWLASLANATNYYVDVSKSDVNNGLTPSTAFATINKFISVAVSGDSCFLNKGNTFNEKFKVPFNNIYIGSYGSGSQPVINGFVSVTGLSDSSNIWTKTIAGLDSLNTVQIGGNLVAKGRYPNTGYLTFSTLTDTSLICASLTGTPDFTGSEVVVRAARWLLDIAPIKVQSANTLKYDSIGVHAGTTGFFIQNSVKCLDTANEWYFNYSTKQFGVYSTSSPSVQISQFDTLCYLNNLSSVTIDGITFQGSNKGAIIIDSCNHITIENCTFNNNGRDAIYGKKSNKVSVVNNTISNSLNGAINLLEKNFWTPNINTCDSAYVHGNTIRRTGTLAGMGGTDEGKYIAIFTAGNGSEVSNNTVDSTGYIAVYFYGYNTLIKNNIISNFCFVKDDGAGVYTIVSYLPVHNDGSIVRGNIISKGLTAIPGATPTLSTEGIYFDTQTLNVTADSNTISTCADVGIFFHQTKYINILNNTLFNNGYAQMKGSQLQTLQLHMVSKNNIFCTLASNYLFNPELYLSPYQSFDVSDSNYYYNQYYGKIVQNAGIYYNLPQWVAYSSLDSNSKNISFLPLINTDTAAVLAVNSTSTSISYPINFTNIDAKGNVYNNQVTIPPYSSKVLFRSLYYIYTSKKLLGLKFKKVKKV
jgi:parallel beta-helix repeat protein